jgi:signal transduction histidine kinase
MTDSMTEPRFFDLYREPTGITPLSAEERAVLRAVNQRVAALPTLDDVIDLLFERTDGIFPFDRLGLAFVEENERRVVSRYVRAAYDHTLLNKGYGEDLRDSSLERVLRQGTPRIIDDLERYLAEHPSSRSTALLVREGVRSSLTCPLVVEGRIVGFMFRSSRTPHAYTQHHVELQMALTERLSQAVEKAWRIEQLTAANRSYTEMLQFVSHELKNPVASMVTDARLLRDGYLGPVEDQQRRKLERMITKGEYLLDLVREYLDLARVEGGELRVDLKCEIPFVEQVVDPALEMVRPQLEAAGMQLASELPSSPPLKADCDPTLLTIVLVNLLANAAKYGRPGGQVRLTVAPGGRGLRVTVWNEGPGFARAERSRLFRKFSRLRTPSTDERRGTGLGLYNSWRIVQLHHGHMRADSQQGEWAEFTFEIPQPLCTADIADELNPASET